MLYDPPMTTSIAMPLDVLPSRFAYLMGLYAENYHRLAHVFAPQRLGLGRYRSCLDDGVDLRLEVLERHRYTLDLRLAYVRADGGELAPSAQLRMYHDAHVAEVQHFHADRRLVQVFGPLQPARTLFQRRLRMSSFLNRWLDYLAEQGHSAGTLEREEARGRLDDCA